MQKLLNLYSNVFILVNALGAHGNLGQNVHKLVEVECRNELERAPILLLNTQFVLLQMIQQ